MERSGKKNKGGNKISTPIIGGLRSSGFGDGFVGVILS